MWIHRARSRHCQCYGCILWPVRRGCCALCTLFLKCFNNSTFFNVVCISWTVKCWISECLYEISDDSELSDVEGEDNYRNRQDAGSYIITAVSVCVQQLQWWDTGYSFIVSVCAYLLKLCVSNITALQAIILYMFILSCTLDVTFPHHGYSIIVYMNTWASPYVYYCPVSIQQLCHLLLLAYLHMPVNCTWHMAVLW